MARRLVLWALALHLAIPSLAQEPPVVRVEVTPEEVAVGEPVTVRLTVLCSTFFPEPPRFPAAELTNAITRQLKNGSRPTTAQVNGETWSGVIYNYQVYPLLGATYRFSDESVAVTCATPGSIKGPTTDVMIDEVVFTAVVPEGAESLDPYVAGRFLTLTQRVEGDPEALEAGGALVVSYVAELDGLPAMFLPPLVDIEETPGVSVYADQPVVEDTQPARRTERYTFVFEAGGDFLIPGASLDWWDRENGRIENSSVEPMTVSVVGEPLPVPAEEPPPAEQIDWRTVLLLALLLIVAWRLLARLMPKLTAARKRARAERLASEEYAFGRLEKALRGKDRRKAHAALLAWIERVAPGLGLIEFTERYGDAKLGDELQEMSRALYREEDDEINLKRLLRPLTKARRQAKAQQAAHGKYALPPLNP